MNRQPASLNEFVSWRIPRVRAVVGAAVLLASLVVLVLGEDWFWIPLVLGMGALAEGLGLMEAQAIVLKLTTGAPELPKDGGA